MDLFYAYLAGLFTIPAGFMFLLLIALIREAWSGQ